MLLTRLTYLSKRVSQIVIGKRELRLNGRFHFEIPSRFTFTLQRLGYIGPIRGTNMGHMTIHGIVHGDTSNVLEKY